MFDYGKIICTTCMNEVESGYYIPELNVAVRLKRNKLGHHKASLVEEKPEIKIGSVKNVKKLNGLFKEGEVDITTEDAVFSCKLGQNNRICLHCYKKNRDIRVLPRLTGYYRTYAVGVVGCPSTGKTTLMDATIKNAVKDKRIVSKDKRADVVENETTQLGKTEGLLAEFVVGRSGANKANILFLDTPGELFSRRKEIANKNIRMQEARIDNVDGLIYLVEKGSDSSADADCLSEFTEADRKIPLAIVMSKSDQLKKECIENGGCIRVDDTTVLTTDYFEKQKNVEKMGVYDQAVHMLRDKKIIHQLVPGVANNMNEERENIAYFVVSSGESIPDNPKAVNITKAVNVTNPLKYLLGTFGIYRYKEGRVHD